MMPPASPLAQPIALDVAKVRDVLGSQVLEILRLQSEVETLQATIVSLQGKIDALMEQRKTG